ncbi:Heterokaryon incompatibility protein 6 like [Verticillium longisporum]|nr:Heterokaryon incompatibility protein 6 like [Verticillium longisporum]
MHHLRTCRRLSSAASSQAIRHAGCARLGEARSSACIKGRHLTTPKSLSTTGLRPLSRTATLAMVPRHDHDGRPSVIFSYDDPVLPLDGSHIRILQLFRSGGDTAELQYASPLRCSLIETPIASPRPFKALSYTWGIGDRTHWIDVAGAALAITASLDTALRHIRSEEQDVMIWIDQICINQTDAIEKTTQVQIMEKIYSKADQVIVWLGPSADGSDEMMDCWQDIGQAARDLDIESYYNKEKLSLLQSMLQDLKPSDEVGRNFKALVDRASLAFQPLLQAMIAWNKRSWFQRVWTIQEVGLCREAVFRCGSKIITVELVALACHAFDSSIARLSHNLPEPETLQILAAAQQRNSAHILGSRRRRQRFNQGLEEGETLLALLKKFFTERTSLVTYIPDRIYGLLGLAVDAGRLGIVPDYTDDDPCPSFTAAARAIIESGEVELLSYSQFPKERALERLPSWVPDWRPMLQKPFNHIHDRVDDHQFTSGGETTVTLVPTESISILGIRGYIVDTIEQVTSKWNGGDFQDRLSNFRDAQQLYELAMTKEDPIYDDPQRRAEALWRVPIGDLYDAGDIFSCRAPSAAKFHYDRCIALLEIAVTDDFGADAEEQMANYAKMRHFQKPYSTYQSAVSGLLGMRPFVTRSGFLGMCAGGTTEGDIVVVFCGSRIPHILRPLQGGERFSFVGEAYCDGIMDGEIVQRRPETTFLIV